MNNKETLINHIEDIPETVKLSQIINESLEKTIINDHSQILSSTVKGIFKRSEYFTTEKDFNTIGYKILRKNQLVFSPQNLWMGNINLNKKFEIGFVSPSYKIYNINENKINSLYLGYLVKSNNMIKKYKLISEQGASIVRRNLDIESFLNIEITVPSLSEQQKIASFLSLIDEKIEKQEFKLILLNKYKEGLYKTIFSNVSVESKVSLKDVIIPLKKTSHKSGDGKADGKYIFFTNTTSENFKYFDSYDYDEEIIIANTGGTANFKYYKGKFAAMSDCYIFKTSEKTQYIYYWLDYMKDIIDRLGFRGNGIKHLDKRWFLSLTLELPSFTEQTKIVNLLNSFDFIIDKEIQTLHQLQKMKSGLLQQMFI